LRFDLSVNVEKRWQIQEVSQGHPVRNKPLDYALGGSEFGLGGASLFGEGLFLLGQAKLPRDRR
jgi:hypothetical protein